MTFSNGSQGAKLLQSSFKRTLLSLRENGWKVGGVDPWLGFRLVNGSPWEILGSLVDMV